MEQQIELEANNYKWNLVGAFKFLLSRSVNHYNITKPR